MGAPEDPGAMQVTLNMDEGLRSQLRRTEGIVAIAESYDVDSPEMAEAANKELRGFIDREKAIEQCRDGFVEPAQKILANAKALFNPALMALSQGQRILKDKLAGWTIKEQERVARERREREEVERRARAEAEAKAAIARAQQEEREREARQRAAAAEAERVKQAAEAERLRKEGDAKAAADAETKARAAAAERAKQEERERQAREEGARKEADALLAASAASNTLPIQEAAGPSGFGLRDNWGAEDEPGRSEEELTLLLVMAAAGVGFDEQDKRVLIAPRGDLLALLKRDKSAAGKLAKALKRNFNVPGMRAVNKPVSVSRAA